MNVYVRDVTRQLGILGIQVDVFTRSQDEHVPHVLHDLGYGNRVVHIPAGPEVPLPKKDLVAYLPEFGERILEFAEMKQIHYDLIHSHYWLSGLAANELKKRWGVPVVHMFHTLGIMKQRVTQAGGESESEYRLLGERQVLESADRIIAATPAELSQLQWLYQANPTKIHVIPPGVDLSRFYPIPVDEAKEYIGIHTCDRMLLFVGRIEPLKGIDTLIEAIAAIGSSSLVAGSPFCLIVIGGDAADDPDFMSAEMARLYELRDKFGLDDRITFLGKRSQDTLPYYYSAAEAVVVPSQYESFGMVALEAMACGTPVVASQVGGLAFLVQDGVTGYTVPSDEPDALAGKLTKLLSDTALRKQMGDQAARFARDYSWEIIAGKLIQVYEDLISKGSIERESSRP
jgi:D-inositol-3-phosphate glycosyltransferase